MSAQIDHALTSLRFAPQGLGPPQASG